MRRTVGLALTASFAAFALVACTPDAVPNPTVTVTTTVEAHATITATPAPSQSVPAGYVPNPYARPEWLGAVALPVEKNGLAKPGKTPPELVNRQLEPRPGPYPDPDSDQWFATISEVPADVLARSSWSKNCPVAADELAYIVMPFWGFDNKPHTGEMLINAKWAAKVTPVFKYIYEHKFPIEEMRVTTREEVLGARYGDQNVTSSFECRRSTGGYPTWGEHASGLAIDINPFQNPWVRDGFVYPELSSSYVNRKWLRPGMIETQHAIVTKFKQIGWFWGGNWTTFDDWMHFSSKNR